MWVRCGKGKNLAAMIELVAARGGRKIIGQYFAVTNAPMRRSTARPSPALIKQLYGYMGKILRDSACGHGAGDAPTDDCNAKHGRF